jgi:RNA polymerase sigma-70 factor (ECF subfamily)
MPILPDTSPNPEVAAEIGQQRRIIAHALNALTVAERQLIEMVYFEGLSHSELSQRTGLPLGTVKTRIRSGMIKLREQLSVWESGTWRTRRT